MPWILAQTACDVLAIHVPTDAATVASLLPAGVEPDRHEGSAWCTVLAMRMTGVRPRGLPAVPGLSSFGQVALRVFVRSTATGEPGVAFLALDVSRPFVSAIGRVALGLPFHHGAVDVSEGRVESGPCTVAWHAARPASDGPFFAERDVLFSARRGRLRRSLVQHPAVRYDVATLDGDVTSALAWVGLAPGGPGRPRTVARLPSHVWRARRAPR